MAQLVERSAVNRQVSGSIPDRGAFLLFLYEKAKKLKKAPLSGIEPETCRLTAERSTN